jgi:peptidyl-prolyl cis-trans isomerase SurA
VKDDYNKLSLRAVEEKKQAKLEAWFKEHLPFYYITIDNEFKDCGSLKEWLKFATKN